MSVFVCASVRVLTLCLCLLIGSAGPSLAGGVDNSLYAGLLERHVEAGVVDYAGLKSEEGVLDAYLAVLESVDHTALGRDDALAYWINVYNAYTIKLVLSEYPGVESIKDIGGFFTGPWKVRFIPIAVQGLKAPLHLDNVEKDVVLSEFAEPRVHFAVNCASKSCPPLLGEPYEGWRLDAQLDERARAFINDSAQNAFEGGTLVLSRIFKWYADDFGGDPASYVARYAHGALAQGLQERAEGVRVRFRDYDWSLNGR